jgi:hypothetical protein
MQHKSVTIFDGEGNAVATAKIEFRKEFYAGSVNLERMPESLRLMFEEYEEIVNNQIFSLLDQIEDQISAIPFVAVFDDGCQAHMKDLQIFTKGGTVSFKMVEPVVACGSR